MVLEHGKALLIEAGRIEEPDDRLAVVD